MEHCEYTLRGLSFLTYDERCARLGLDRLELRRLHCDLITRFKSIHGFNCLRSEDFFTHCGEQITRCYPFKLRVQNYRIYARKYFFSSRVVIPCGTNCRPCPGVCCKASLVRFKSLFVINVKKNCRFVTTCKAYK